MPAESAACPTCSAATPAAARYCPSCGLVIDGRSGPRPLATGPNESVASLALVTTVMPYATARAPQTYRLALLLGILVPIIAIFLGLPGYAFAAAAFVVPMVFVVYLYDVNLWEDEPVPIVLATFILGGVLGLGVTWLWTRWLGAQGEGLASALGTFTLTPFLVTCIAAPVVGVLLMLIGPVFLASRPRFDDLMDGLTFGIVSAVAFAAMETLVTNWGMIAGSSATGEVSAWIAVIVNAALLKPIVYGCAVGIAVAEFSGLGEGHDGFTGRFALRTIEAMLAIIAYESGLFLTDLIGGTNGVVLGLVWALIVVGILVLRVRTVLQRALLEGALEAAARAASSKWRSGPDDFCAECEMPLPVDALFCVACGSSVRARSKWARTGSAPDPTGSAS